MLWPEGISTSAVAQWCSATGHQDTPDERYAHLMAVTPEPVADKIRAYADGSAEHCD